MLAIDKLLYKSAQTIVFSEKRHFAVKLYFLTVLNILLIDNVCSTKNVIKII